MIDIRLPYGEQEINLSLPDDRVAAVLTPDSFKKEINRKEQKEIIEKALLSPVDSPCLKELAVGVRDIVLITSDHTRPLPSRLTIPILLGEIRHANPQAEVKILIATGAHRKTEPRELVEKFGRKIVEQEEIFIHDYRNNEELKKVGTLPSGGELKINRMAYEADLIISEGFVEPHFFAGFSGGRKSILPGIAGEKSIHGNHCAEFVANANVRTGNLSDNPMHEDMVYAAECAGLKFTLNIMLNDRGEVAAAVAGDAFGSHLKACEIVREMTEVSAQEAEIVITTNGGYPLDQNIYQAVKGITAAEATCRKGGVIIVAAECREGHGGEGFYRIMTQEKDPAEIHAKILECGREQTISDQWEAQSLLRALKDYSIIMVTNAERNLVENMHMQKAEDIDSALKMAYKIQDWNYPRITVIPNGVGVIVE